MIKLTPEEILAKQRSGALVAIGAVFWIVCALLLSLARSYVKTNNEYVAEENLAILFGTLILSVILCATGAFDGITHYIYPDVVLIPTRSKPKFQESYN